MNNVISTYYSSLLTQIESNTPAIIFWLVLFVLILVLFVIYLAHRITAESSASALKMAKESKTKSEEVGQRIDALNDYLRDVFRKEFGGAMESFDSTVSSVLEEMKEGLVRSVENIERIDAAVKSRRRIDLQVEAGQEKAERMLTGTETVKKDKSADSAPETKPETASEESA